MRGVAPPSLDDPSPSEEAAGTTSSADLAAEEEEDSEVPSPEGAAWLSRASGLMLVVV